MEIVNVPYFEIFKDGMKIIAFLCTLFTLKDLKKKSKDLTISASLLNGWVKVEFFVFVFIRDILSLRLYPQT